MGPSPDYSDIEDFMRTRSAVASLLFMALAAAPALASFSGGPKDEPPTSTQVNPGQTSATTRQEAERLYAGAYWGQSPPVRQRRIPVGGADPYETFTNPLLRSRGALFARPGFYYQAPGGANLRGFAADVAGRWAVALNVEGTKRLLARPSGPLREVALLGFADFGVVDSMAIPSSPAGRAATTLYDGGVGVTTRQQVGDLEWTLRFEVPLIVNRFDFARDVRPGQSRLAFRWQISLEPSF